ncbi:hypothetical protein V495_05170 [Pseudogymnoascus sp. VKM F-4514 (FW-929)]|nr:hypothetical protein V495_05170 [Pseudogymnoascus sp. VKM F-4514 (FW-929)]KFY58316.1 hypothetical protein V497_04903 [Pseudogymnoascus sp. VKM F-4516 (FW-969)]
MKLIKLAFFAIPFFTAVSAVAVAEPAPVTFEAKVKKDADAASSVEVRLHRDSTAATVTKSPAREALPCGERTRLSVTHREAAASTGTLRNVLAATGLLGAQDKAG